MKKKWGHLNTTKALASLSILFAAGVFAPQVLAGGSPLSDMEDRIRELEQEVGSLRGQLGQGGDTSGLEDRLSRLEQMPAGPRGQNMIFFRGGYTALLEDRAGNSFTDTHGIGANLGLNQLNDGDNGWYVGAGFDFLLTPDVWGMAPSTGVLAELMLEWKNYGAKDAITVVPFAECLLKGGAAGVCAGAAHGDIQLSMLTISASPKIKFMEGSKLRPWIIPAGLDFHVISPPSDAATVLDLGVQFAAGLEYEIIPGIKVGFDGRYHYAAGNFTSSNQNLSAAQRNALVNAGIFPTTYDTDQSNTNWTVGGYLGIGF